MGRKIFSLMLFCLAVACGVRAAAATGELVSYVDTSLDGSQKYRLIVDGRPYYMTNIQIRLDKLRYSLGWDDAGLEAIVSRAAADGFNTRTLVDLGGLAILYAYRIRLTLMFKGRLPVSKQLPFEWYDTPNIHLITLKDFQALCDKEGIEIVETRAESRHPLGRIMLLLGMKNLGASKIIAKVRKRA